MPSQKIVRPQSSSHSQPQNKRTKSPLILVGFSLPQSADKESPRPGNIYPPGLGAEEGILSWTSEPSTGLIWIAPTTVSNYFGNGISNTFGNLFGNLLGNDGGNTFGNLLGNLFVNETP